MGYAWHCVRVNELRKLRRDPINMTACVSKDGAHTAAAQFVTVPAAFKNHRVGLCKAVSR